MNDFVTVIAASPVSLRLIDDITMCRLHEDGARLNPQRRAVRDVTATVAAYRDGGGYRNRKLAAANLSELMDELQIRAICSDAHPTLNFIQTANEVEALRSSRLL
ncbi:hypothetical protein [Sphingomonas sp. PWP1-2]|uniref:hypothetical protein n=1 Tax=Sphingomonas sp. PWP1-2 TaxID=2804558 RepID=UPI003CF30256